MGVDGVWLRSELVAAGLVQDEVQRLRRNGRLASIRRGAYGRFLKPGEEPGDAVFAEKRREDALRAEGLMVVRWTWADLSAFAPVAARLRTALGL
jgi:hypothetical protein